MKNLVEIKNSEPRVSHRIIADNTGNKVLSLQKTITDYLSDFEEFGDIEVELKKVQTAGGVQKQKTFWLNESQATLLMTYLRNSDVVRNFKKALVREFFEMREKLENPNIYEISGRVGGLTKANNELRKELDTLKANVNQRFGNFEDIQNSMEHSSILEIIYQMKSFQSELHEFERIANARQRSINIFMKVFENKYPKCKDYIESLGEKDLGSIRTRF